MRRIVYVEVDEGVQLQCECPSDLAIHEGDQCIIESDRITEFGCVMSFKDVEDDKAAAEKMPELLRRATLQDQAKADENAVMGKIAIKTCAARAEKYGLVMRLVRVRYSFDRKVLNVLFHSEERVDFREMVKELAGELRTRVEMNQIGVRDEAGIIGGVGSCGRTLCCCTWLSRFESINVKMAKVQRLSLNPVAISGMCGRLKCCLRYENDQYKEADRNLPRDGDWVECPEGKGRIIDKNILAGRLRVRMDDERILEYSIDEIKRTGG